ncbi:hypothetical protein TNCV_1335021 [Trichonephila clavipes]|nr:hypothetical protein TNCV_1335021 [Trichonephila clavipes]
MYRDRELIVGIEKDNQRVPPSAERVDRSAAIKRLRSTALNSRLAASSLARFVEGEVRWEVPDYPRAQNWGENEQNRTVTSMMLKAKVNDRRKNLAFSRDEFCGPRPGITVDQEYKQQQQQQMYTKRTS